MVVTAIATDADVVLEAAAADPSSRSREVHEPTSKIVRFSEHEPLRLDCQQDLAPYQIAYQTYGTLNAAKSNAILVCHALTGDQHVANPHPVTGKPGWWDIMIGPGRPVDTDRFFVICANVLGGCMGSTGPASIDPRTAKPYGLDFPVITVADMVRAQARLIDRLGIDRLFSVIGGSMGGMQVLEWASRFTDRVDTAIPIATASPCSTPLYLVSASTACPKVWPKLSSMRSPASRSSRPTTPALMAQFRARKGNRISRSSASKRSSSRSSSANSFASQIAACFTPSARPASSSRRGSDFRVAASIQTSRGW